MSILALALASLLGTFSTGLGAVRTTASHAQALGLARSLLDEHTRERGFRTGRQQGRLGPMAWTVDIRPAKDLAGLVAASPSAWRLYRVRVAVAMPGKRSIELESIRLGKADGGI